MSPAAVDSDYISPSTPPPMPSRALPPGVYVPTVAIFTADDGIDEAATARHAVRLARAGVAGLVAHGPSGEAVHLDGAERAQATQVARRALDAAGFARLPLVAGCGAQGTRETARLCEAAARAGASHALVLPPSYYYSSSSSSSGSTAVGSWSVLTRESIRAHFCAVADASPIPLVVYNFPAAAGGLDLTSDDVVALAAHPNIVGAKLTCGNAGKLARVVAGAGAARRQGKEEGAVEFGAFGGSADALLPALAVGGRGVMAGLANVAPRACVEVWRRWEAGDGDAAARLQALVAVADWGVIRGGHVAVKAALARYFGYGGAPRPPCALPRGAELAALEDCFAELVAVERELEEGQDEAGEAVCRRDG